MSEALLVQEAGAAAGRGPRLRGPAVPAQAARPARGLRRGPRRPPARPGRARRTAAHRTGGPGPQRLPPRPRRLGGRRRPHRLLRRHQRRALARRRTADRPRPVRPGRVRRPGLARRRPRRHRPPDRPRPGHRTRRRPRQPLGRPAPRPDHRRQRGPAGHGHRAGAPGDRARVLPPARPDRPGHRGHRLVRYVEARTGPGAHPEVPRLRLGGPAQRARKVVHRPPRAAALAGRARHHLRGARLPHQHHRRGGAVLPRRRHQTAHPVLGADAHRGRHLVPGGPHVSADPGRAAVHHRARAHCPRRGHSHGTRPARRVPAPGGHDQEGEAA